MTRFLFTLMFPCLFLGSTALCREDVADSTAAGPERIQTTLPSGMQVLVKNLPKAALVRVGMFYAAGSALEPDSLAGLAHFCEHLLTESSLNHPDGELIRQQTLYSTYRNAYTGSAFMQFDTECLPAHLPRILELEADRLRGVVTDPVSFEREKGVVLEELAMRRRLTPTREFTEGVFHASYPGHPFGRRVGGTAETVSLIGLQDFLGFRDRFIRPERSALVVMGPLDPAEILADIERIFATEQQAATVFAEIPPYPPVTAGQHVIDSHDHSGMRFCLSFRVPLKTDRDAAWAEVLPSLMAESGFHPRISSVPDEMMFMLVGVSGYSRPSTNNEDHWGTIFYEFDPEQQSLRYMERYWERISAFVNEVLAPTEFKERLARALTELDGPSLKPGASTALGAALVNGNTFMTPDKVREVLASAEPQDFLEFMERWFSPDRMVVGVSHGRDSERPAAIALARSRPVPPSRGADSALEGLTQEVIEPVLKEYSRAGLIRLERSSLANGIPVTILLIPDADDWSCALSRTFAGVGDMRPGKKPGITQIYNTVVDYDEEQRRHPDRETTPRPLPYDLHFRLNWNTARHSVQGPAEKVEDILKTLDARLKSREFNSIRWYAATRWGDDYLREIRERKVNVATAWRWEQILGSKHPSLGQWAPDPEAFRQVNYKDLANLHKKYVQDTEGVQLLVAGGIAFDRIKAPLDRTVGQLDPWRARKPGKPPKTRIQGIRGKIVPDLTRGDVVLDLSFSPQAPRPSRRPVAAALVLKTALRQTLTSRLREKEGLTYHVSTAIHPLTDHFLWEISVTCQPGQQTLVLSLTLEELARVISEGFTDDEIARARLACSGQAIGNLSGLESGLDYLHRLSLLGEIPHDPLRDFFLVSANEVNDLARAALDPGQFVFTTTGPLFEEALEEFDLPDE